MDTRFGFVILHYLSLEDTIECIESIKDKIDVDNYEIVVVDNCSPNHTGIMLIEKYRNDDRVKVILNDVNSGFSKGNNIGIKQARKDGCEFIVALNNDTVMIQDDFVQTVVSEYNKSGFGVLGPKVFDPDGLNNSNPLSVKPIEDIKSLKTIAAMWKRKYYECLLGLDKLRDFMAKEVTSVNNDVLCCTERLENIELHGCCLVFSPLFFEYMDGFEEITFMYGEETILRMNCIKYKLKMVYNPMLTIYHKEAVSSKKERRNKRGKLAFLKRMYLAADAIYTKALEEGK